MGKSKWGYGDDKSDKGGDVSNKEYEPSEAVKSIERYPEIPMPERGIGPGCVKLYEVKSAIDSNNALSSIATYFPYYDKKCKTILGYKKKDLLKPKKKRFSAHPEGAIGPKSSALFGQATVGEKRHTLYITEGEEDCMALNGILRTLNSQNENPKYRGELPNCVSIGFGTLNAVEHLMTNRDFIEQFKQIILVFDGDKATPEEELEGIVRGVDAVSEVTLAFDKLNIRYVPMGDLKDVCEYVAEGRGDELARNVVFNSIVYLPPEVILLDGSDVELDKLLKPIGRGWDIPFLPNLTSCLGGMRKHEMTLLIADTNIGKSLLAKQISMSIMRRYEDEVKTACLYLEDGHIKAMQNYIALYNNVSPSKFRETPTIITRDQAREAHEFLKPRVASFNTDGQTKLSAKNLSDVVKRLAIMGYNLIVIDHLSFISSGSDKDERRNIDTMLTDLNSVFVKYPVHILCVAHINRQTSTNYLKPIDPETKQIIYPHYAPVSRHAGKGSSSYEQIASNMIVMEKEVFEDESMRGKVRLVVKKNRETGQTRICDELWFNPTTGAFQV